MPAPQLLHVEDDAPLRRSVALTLADEGFTVLSAGTGAEALALLDRAPDLVLTDLGLPDVDGVELCRRVRDRTPVPLLVLSVQSGPDDVARALAAGADDFLVKPFPADDLARRLRALLAADLPAAAPTVDLPRLSVVERRLLAALGAEPEVAVASDVLLRRVWGAPPSAGTAVLLARVASLRRELEAAGRASILSTGTGHRLC